MNASYVKSILGRLNIATTYVAKRNNDKFYPKLNREIKDMSDGEIKESIQKFSKKRLNIINVASMDTFYKGQDVAIVGGGDTAAEEATYLSNICSNVTMIVRKGEMRASKAMQHRVNSRTNIDVKYFSEIEEVLGENVVEGVRIINNQTSKIEEIKVTGLFIAIGHKPNTDIFKGQLDMDDAGYIITDGKTTNTNYPGVFASGDVQDKEYRQAVTAAGTGCMAALDAERYLASLL